MKKIGPSIEFFLTELAGNKEQARINMRAEQVRDRYRQVINMLYRQTAPLFLAHTNNVYIMNKNGARTLIVYVDESIFAAELNAQRELVKLKLLELFGEDVQKFEIYVSRGKYKNNHPFLLEPGQAPAQSTTPLPLDQAERNFVESTASTVESQELRTSFQKAMTAAMELNKAENGKTS